MNDIKVELISPMGTDKAVAEIARVSFSKDMLNLTELNQKDESLLNFLARGFTSAEHQDLIDRMCMASTQAEADALIDEIKHKATHWTPFAHTAFTLKISAPIPIRTQAFKHYVGLVANEESRRYISSEPLIYIPEHFRSIPEGSIKQGSGSVHEHSNSIKELYENHCNEAVRLYLKMIEDKVCPEQARFILPQGTMVTWIWTGNLVAFANFFNKRIDKHAQAEIQEMALRIQEAIRPVMPVSWDALTTSFR